MSGLRWAALCMALCLLGASLVLANQGSDEQAIKQALSLAEKQQRQADAQRQAEQAKQQTETIKAQGKALRQELRSQQHQAVNAMKQESQAITKEYKIEEQAVKSRILERSRLNIAQLRQYGKRFAPLTRKEKRFFARRFPHRYRHLKRIVKWAKSRHNNGSLVQCPANLNDDLKQEATIAGWLVALSQAPKAYKVDDIEEDKPLPLPTAFEEFTERVNVLGLTVARAVREPSRFGLRNYRAPYYITKSDKLNTIFVTFVSPDVGELSDWSRIGAIKYVWAKYEINGLYYGHVHKAFLNLWARSGLNVINDLKEVRGDSSAKVVFTGFDMAGAMAQLFGLEAAIRLKIVPTIYTFGSPRVGSQRFARWIQHSTRHYRFVYGNDIMAEMPSFVFLFGRGARYHGIPPKQFGFYHGDTAAFQLTRGFVNGRTRVNCFDESVPSPRVSLSDHNALRYLFALFNWGSPILPAGILHYQYCFPAGVSLDSFSPELRSYLPPVITQAPSCPSDNSAIACLPRQVRRLFHARYHDLLPAALVQLPECPALDVSQAPARPDENDSNSNSNSNDEKKKRTLSAYAKWKRAKQRADERAGRRRQEQNKELDAKKDPEEHAKAAAKYRERDRKYTRNWQERERKARRYDARMERRKKRQERNSKAAATRRRNRAARKAKRALARQERERERAVKRKHRRQRRERRRRKAKENAEKRNHDEHAYKNRENVLEERRKEAERVKADAEEQAKEQVREARNKELDKLHKQFEDTAIDTLDQQSVMS